MNWGSTYSQKDGLTGPDIDAGLPAEVEDATPRSIDGPHDVEYALTESGDVLSGRCHYTIDVTLIGFANKWDFEILNDGITISEADWSPSMMLVEAERSVELTVDVEIDATSREVFDMSLINSRRVL